MYLPTSDARQRKEITEEFFSYRSMTQKSIWDRYSAYEHWAKIEVTSCNSGCKINVYMMLWSCYFDADIDELVAWVASELLVQKNVLLDCLHTIGWAALFATVSCLIIIVCPFLPRFQRTRTNLLSSRPGCVSVSLLMHITRHAWSWIPTRFSRMQS